MTDLRKMNHEELLKAYDNMDWNEHQFSSSSTHRSYNSDLRAEILRRLSPKNDPVLSVSQDEIGTLEQLREILGDPCVNPWKYDPWAVIRKADGVVKKADSNLPPEQMTAHNSVPVGAAPSEGMKARCPKCGSPELTSKHIGTGEHIQHRVSCSCGFYNWITSYKQFAQFFALSPAQSGEPPRFDVIKCVDAGCVFQVVEHRCGFAAARPSEPAAAPSLEECARTVALAIANRQTAPSTVYPQEYHNAVNKLAESLTELIKPILASWLAGACGA